MKIISCLMLFCAVLTAEGKEFSLTFTSEGTRYPFSSVTRITSDGKVCFVRRKKGTNKICEKWEGRLRKEDLNDFRDTIIVKCGFFRLPGRVEKGVPVKDSSWDDFSVTYGNDTHAVGGYAARHSEEYVRLYRAFNGIMNKVIDRRIIVRP